MNVFVFQAGLDRADIEWAIRPGMRDTWYATRHQQAMRLRDIVFFGMARIELALYGWGASRLSPISVRAGTLTASMLCTK